MAGTSSPSYGGGGGGGSGGGASFGTFVPSGGAPIDRSTAELIRDLTTRTMQPQILGDIVMVAKPDGEWEYTDRECGLDFPTRKRGTVMLTHPASLIKYSVQHGKREGTNLYVMAPAMSFAAVLNDDGGETAGWRDHVAVLTLEQTPGWKRWNAANGTLMPQEQFAELIEDGLAEIAEPAGADLLELAQSFQASRSASFSGGTRLASGQVTFQYTEDVAASGGRGSIAVPPTILLRLVPFYGGEARNITARFRYRLNGSKLSLGFIIDGLPELLRSVVEAVATEVSAATGLVPLYAAGVPQPTTPRH